MKLLFLILLSSSLYAGDQTQRDANGALVSTTRDGVKRDASGKVIETRTTTGQTVTVRDASGKIISTKTK